MSWHALAFGALLLAYLLLTLAVIFRSPVLSLDTDLWKLDLRHRYPEWETWVHHYIVLGQRGPATLLFLPWFCWVAWRHRSPRPLILLGAGLVLLNLSVAVVKLATGRLGPLRTSQAHDVFVGGNIFPSGHVSNSVVLYGLMAWIAVKYRKTGIAVAVFLSVTIGLGTVYLDTHWFSDVIGGLIAGGLVLLALPWVMPTVERWVDTVWSRLRNRFAPPEDSDDREQSEGSPVPAELSAAGSAQAAAARRIAAGHAGQGTAAHGHAAQGKATPVSSVARSQSFAATVVSLDARDESTRCGNPRISPIPSGP